MTFKPPLLVYRPKKFYTLKNKDRRIYDLMVGQDFHVLNNSLFFTCDPEMLYNFGKWLKDEHVNALIEGKYKGVPVEVYRAQVMYSFEDIENLLAAYSDRFEFYLTQRDRNFKPVSIRSYNDEDKR